jgi:hypothetical protein
MKTPIGYSSLACAALALLIEALPVYAVAPPMAVGEAGDYKVVVEVLPPGPYAGPKAELVRDGGGQPLARIGSLLPNHRVEVTVTNDGQLVKQATVAILYRNLGPHGGSWVSIPVVRSHVVGKGPETTQFGNDLRLGPGLCEVSVSVNGQGAAIVRFMLRS